MESRVSRIIFGRRYISVYSSRFCMLDNTGKRSSLGVSSEWVLWKKKMTTKVYFICLIDGLWLLDTLLLFASKKIKRDRSWEERHSETKAWKKSVIFCLWPTNLLYIFGFFDPSLLCKRTSASLIIPTKIYSKVKCWSISRSRMW